MAKMNRRNHQLMAQTGFIIYNYLDISTAKKQVEALNQHDHFATRIANKSNDKTLKITNLANEAQAHIYLNDEISKYYGVSAADMVAAFDEIGDKDVVLHINCVGGDVMQAREICATIASHKGKVKAQIEGLCASAATFITCACDSVVMNDGSLFMIHNASGLCWGDYIALTKQADILRKITDNIADDYVAKTGKDKTKILQLMSDETFYTAKEALDAGFVDELINSKIDDGDGVNNIIETVVNTVTPIQETPPVTPKADVIASNKNYLHAQAIGMHLKLSENA